MSIDLRGFDYPLEPLRCRWQWQLDALQARLGQLEEAVRCEREALADLRSRYDALGQEAGEAVIRRLDPDHHRRCLLWLTQVRGEIAAGETRLAELQDDREAMRRQCLAQRHKVDLIEAHRDDCVVAFAADEARRLSAQADRDWLARRPVQDRPSFQAPNASLVIEAET